MQLEVSVLVSVRAHIERSSKALVAKRDPREPARVPKLARSRKIKLKLKIKIKLRQKLKFEIKIEMYCAEATG